MDETRRDRLFKAIETSFRSTDWARRVMRGLVESYAGSSYGRETRAKFKTMLPLMNQAVTAYTMVLAANRPRVLMTAKYPELLAFSKKFQTALNNLAEEICLEKTIRRWIMDAFFGVGVIKVHMADSGQVMMENGFEMDPGTPYASNLSLDNFVFDATKNDWNLIHFAGDMYRIPFDELSGPMYDQAAVADLKPTSKYQNEDSDRHEFLSKGVIDIDEFEPMIDLADIWIPRDGKIYTYAVKSKMEFILHGPPVAVMDWDGPEFGPYHLLGFNSVPDNILPAGPAAQLQNLEDLINNIMRKQARRARNQKMVHAFNASDIDGVKNVKNAVDDEFVNATSPESIKTIMVGGVDGPAQAFLLGTMEMFDRMAGNLTAMMGLGVQAPTASQEQMIHGAVSQTEAQMQYRVIDATRKLMRDLGFMLWVDQFKQIPGRIPIDGAPGYHIDATWTPEEREGNFFDYNLDIDVYSMAYQSPAQRLQAMNTILTQLYLPAMPLLMQQGGTIDFLAVTDTLSELMNEPRLKEWIKFMSVAPQGEGAGPTGLEPAKPAVTSRNYTRKNVPTGGTPESRSHVQQQAWMGGNNPQQEASLKRSA
jgi:hypothetical protein